MTSDKPRRKPSVQLLLSDMQAQTGCLRQRIADKIDQTALQYDDSYPPFYELKRTQMQPLRRFKNPLSGIEFDVVHASCILIDHILYAT